MKIATFILCLLFPLKIVSQNTIPEFEFLRQKKFRIKALKYNFDNGFGSKIVSMGIVFSTSILPKDSAMK